MSTTIRYPMGGEGLYNIGGVIFQNGVATVDELTHAQKEVLALIGATYDDGDSPVEAPTEEAPAPAPAEPSAPEQPAADAPTGPEEISSETSLQEAADPYEVHSTESDTTGEESLESGSGRHADTDATAE